ncbi:MAG: NADH-quinone oxidoreductase subunit NuoN, partial [Alphaproteobacteria bacterium]
MIPNLLPAIPEMILAAGTCTLLLLGVLHDAAKAWIPFLAKALIGALLLYLLICPTQQAITFNGLFVADAFATFCKLLILGFAGGVLLASSKTLALEDLEGFEYPLLILFSLLGMMVMVSANDLLTLFMGLELQSLSLYILAAFRREDGKSSEAALKYFVLGALSTGILLFGISFVYGFTGTTQFQTLATTFAQKAHQPLGTWVGLVFIIAGLSFKIAAVPFHMWTPDVYEGTPTSVTTFIATVPKIAAFGLLLRLLLGPFNGFIAQWYGIISCLACASMLLGAFAALNQTNIKRLLAYRAIGHMGYALIGVASGGAGGATATLLYIFLYALMTLGFFACLLDLLRRGYTAESIQDLRGLWQTHPGTAFIMSFLLFSMAGIPPLAGFLGKLYVFQAAVSKGLYGLAVVGVLASVVAAAYYLYIIKVMVMDNPQEQSPPTQERHDPVINL